MAPVQGWLRQADRFTRSLAKWTLDREYRTLEKIRSVPRYTAFTTDILGTELHGVDSASFVNSYAEIFGRQIYRFQTTSPRPRIVDCGANIGLSVIYFKRLFPTALVTAYEADPSICGVLARNLATFGLRDVTVHNAAVWNDDTVIEFLTEGADAGRIATTEGPEPQARRQRVRAIRLRDHLDHQPIDLLKMDIEGGELAVLQDCSSSLSHVARVFVEYHSFENQPQQLHVLLELLADSGFRCYPEPVSPWKRPFIDRSSICGMDVQVNVFAFRDAQTHR